MRKSFVLSLFVVFAMLLGACSAASTPTPEAVSEPEAPVVEEAPEESMPEEEMEKTIVDITCHTMLFGRFRLP